MTSRERSQICDPDSSRKTENSVPEWVSKDTSGVQSREGSGTSRRRSTRLAERDVAARRSSIFFVQRTTTERTYQATHRIHAATPVLVDQPAKQV